MKTYSPTVGARLRCFLVWTLLSWGSLTLQARVLDNFDDNTKSGWKDFTFIPGFGLPVESDGQFRFEQPAAGQPAAAG